MIVFLSASFLRRLELEWKPNLRAVLMGHRNLFFFTPDMLREVAEISSETLNQMLERSASVPGWELLGTIAPGDLDLLPIPGLAQLITGEMPDPFQWKAWVFLLEEGDLKKRALEIRLSGRSTN